MRESENEWAKNQSQSQTNEANKQINGANIKKTVVFDDGKKLQSSVKRSAVCALFRAFALEAPNSNSWIMVCLCIQWPARAFFVRPPFWRSSTFDFLCQSLSGAAHHSIPCVRSVLVNLLLLLLLLASWSLSIYLFFRLHCNKSFKSILCNFITYSAFVLHFTNIYYGNIYANSKTENKISETILTEPMPA